MIDAGEDVYGVNQPMAQLGQEGGGYIPTEQEMREAMRRSVALGILPDVIKSSGKGWSSDPSLTAHTLVSRAYALADEMIKQGYKEKE